MFSFPDGAFTPVIADYHAIYLDGYGTLYQMLPGRPRHHAAAGTRTRHTRRAAHRRRNGRAPGAARKHK